MNRYPAFIEERCYAIKDHYTALHNLLHAHFEKLKSSKAQWFDVRKDTSFDAQTFAEFVDFLKSQLDIDYHIVHGDYNTDPDEMSREYVRVYVSPKNGFIETVVTTTTHLRLPNGAKLTSVAAYT